MTKTHSRAAATVGGVNVEPDFTPAPAGPLQSGHPSSPLGVGAPAEQPLGRSLPCAGCGCITNDVLGTAASHCHRCHARLPPSSSSGVVPPEGGASAPASSSPVPIMTSASGGDADAAARKPAQASIDLTCDSEDLEDDDVIELELVSDDDVGFEVRVS